MDVQEIAPGLVRWTAPHPEWRAAADWPRDVGCVAYEAPDALVLIDPLVPPEAEEFWTLMDERARARDRVVVLTTLSFHRRSRDEVVRRYGASTSRARKTLPQNVETIPVRGAGETMVWLPEHGALVPGDLILGNEDGGLRLCPDSWLRYLPSRITGRELRELLRPLLELPIERVLVSHGRPVLSDGRRALAAALA